MSNIQIYGATGIPVLIEKQLVESDKKVLSLLTNKNHNPKMADQTPDQWKELIKNILLKAQVKLGLNPKTKEENALIMPVINEDLGSNFPNMTRLEVYAAVDAGLNGQFVKNKGDSVFFTPSNLVQWISAWVEEVKKPVMKRVMEIQHNMDQQSEPTEKDSLITSFRTYIKAIKDAVESEVTFEDYGRVVYDFLTKLDLIQPPTKDDIDKIAVHELHVAQVHFERGKIRSLKNLLADGDHKPSMTLNSVKAVAERQSVQRKLKDISSMSEEDILDYLEMVNERVNDYIIENNL